MATTWAGTALNQGITRTAMNDFWNTNTNGGYPWCDGCSQPADSLQLITRAYYEANYVFTAAQFEKLAEILQTVKGGETQVLIDYYGDNARATLRLSNAWQVEASDELLHELKIWLGNTAIRLSY